VLFSGTPCQIAGLKRYLQIRGLEPEDRLLTVEVICHGVASDKFFRDYIAHLEGRYGGKAVACNFRSKSRPGKIQDMSVEFDNGKVYQAASTKFDWFYSAYNARNLILRPSCYQCRYARPEREADVSLGDHWGDQSGGKARSLIIANTQQGLLWTQRLGRDMVLEKLQPQQVHQDRLHSPCKKPESYDRFWEIYEQKGYLAAQEFLGNNTPKGKAKSLAAAMTVRLGLDRAAKKLKKR
jgi:coenzyme F420-reducing hydrogenase beta subunit